MILLLNSTLTSFPKDDECPQDENWVAPTLTLHCRSGRNQGGHWVKQMASLFNYRVQVRGKSGSFHWGRNQGNAKRLAVQVHGVA